jgi:hypothetical protein
MMKIPVDPARVLDVSGSVLEADVLSVGICGAMIVANVVDFVPGKIDTGRAKIGLLDGFQHSLAGLGW